MGILTASVPMTQRRGGSFMMASSYMAFAPLTGSPDWLPLRADMRSCASMSGCVRRSVLASISVRECRKHEKYVV
jgi:hypothetical protein